MSSNEIERRYLGNIVEVRSAESRTIGGYAAMFDKRSRNLGGFVERVDPRAFNRDRGRNWPGQGSGVIARYEHDSGFVLGTTRSGALRLATDDQGLTYEVDLLPSRQDVFELVQRRDIQHSSFAFATHEDDWTQSDEGYPMRTLLSVGLIDVAPVLEPAYPDATVALRSLASKFDADVDEVRKYAQDDELRKFFVRTDGDGPKHNEFGPAALASLREIETPSYD